MRKLYTFILSLNRGMVIGLLFVWGVVGAWCITASAYSIASEGGHPEVVAPMNWAAAAVWYIGGTIIVLALFTAVHLGEQIGQRQYDADQAVLRSRVR